MLVILTIWNPSDPCDWGSRIRVMVGNESHDAYDLGISPVTVFGVFFIFIFWLRWVFVAVRGLSLVAASGGCFLLRCAGFSLQ